MIHRRDAMMRLGQCGLGALTLPGLLQAEQTLAAVERTVERTGGKAKNCILVYLWGGPPQQDMFDMKPDAADGIRSHFKPIDTVVPGIAICDQLPQMARHADKMAIIRSYTHGSNLHRVSVYHSLTGREKPSLARGNQRKRSDFPDPGSIVSYFKRSSNLPSSVTIPRPIGHDGVTYSGTYAGFLGPKYDPMELQPPGEVKTRASHSLDLPDGLDVTRIQARFGLLSLIESHDRAMQAGSSTFSMGRYREQAFRMLTSAKAKGAFDVGREPDKVRDRYGRNEYGENFLLARRLIEAGVRLVTIVWVYICPDGNVANVWDNHGGSGSLGKITGYAMLKEKYCLPPLDQGFSALLEDLSQRGMLDDTVVAMLGEFGRTPKINKNLGRDHWGACQSVVLAGGGIRGGQIYGSSDKQAAYPASHAVSPSDYLATLYYALGLPPESVIYDPQNRPNHISDGTPITSLFG